MANLVIIRRLVQYLQRRRGILLGYLPTPSKSLAGFIAVNCDGVLFLLVDAKDTAILIVASLAARFRAIDTAHNFRSLADHPKSVKRKLHVVFRRRCTLEFTAMLMGASSSGSSSRSSCKSSVFAVTVYSLYEIHSTVSVAI